MYPSTIAGTIEVLDPNMRHSAKGLNEVLPRVNNMSVAASEGDVDSIQTEVFGRAGSVPASEQVMRDGWSDKDISPEALERAIDTVNRNTEQELQDEQSQLEGREQDVSTFSRELLNMSTLTAIALHRLYAELDEYRHDTPEAEAIQAQVGELLDHELEAVSTVRSENSSPEILAFCTSRSLELAKMKIDLKVRWQEKVLWDMHLDDSDPQKIPEQEKLNALIRDELNPVIEEVLDTLEAEQQLLEHTYGSIDESPRLHYVLGSRVAYRHLLGRPIQEVSLVRGLTPLQAAKQNKPAKPEHHVSIEGDALHKKAA